MTGWVSARAEQTTTSPPSSRRSAASAFMRDLDALRVGYQTLVRQRVALDVGQHRDVFAQQRRQRLGSTPDLLVVAHDVEDGAAQVLGQRRDHVGTRDLGDARDQRRRAARCDQIAQPLELRSRDE